MKQSSQEQVVEFMNNLKHPLKEEVEEIRLIILSTNEQISETIKWNAPNFRYNDEDRLTLNLNGKGFFRLIFHCGAKVREGAGEGPLIDDTTGLLEWLANDRAVIKFTDMDDVKAKREKLAIVITKWIEAPTTIKPV